MAKFMKQRLMALATASALGALSVSIAPAHALGLLQAYDAALQNDPQFRSAQAENRAGQEYKAIGRSTLLPTAQLSYSTSKNKGETISPTLIADVDRTTPTDYTSLSTTLSVRQALFNLDSFARYRQGIAQTKFSDAQFASRSKDLVLRLTGAYVEAKFAEDQLRLITAQRDSLIEQKRVNDRMFAMGEAARTDMLETQAKLDVAEAQLIESRDSLQTTRNTLASIIGTEVNELDGFAADLRIQSDVSHTLSDWKNIALTQNEELAAARFNLEASEQEIRKAQAGHAPRLDLTASYNKGMSESLTTQNQNITTNSIGIQLIIPLYSGGYVSAVSKQAVANRDKARADMDATTAKLMVDLQKEYNALTSGMAKMAALQKAVDSGSLLVEATKQSVKGGVRINLDVLNAEQQLMQSRRDLARHAMAIC